MMCKNAGPWIKQVKRVHFDFILTSGGLRGRDPACTVSFVQHSAVRDATEAKEGHVFMSPAAVRGGWQMHVPYGEQDDTVPLVCDRVWMNQIRGLACCWGPQHARPWGWYETWQNRQHKDNKEIESFLRVHGMLIRQADEALHNKREKTTSIPHITT